MLDEFKPIYVRTADGRDAIELTSVAAASRYLATWHGKRDTSFEETVKIVSRVRRGRLPLAVARDALVEFADRTGILLAK